MATYTGTSIVDYLKSIGKPSDYSSRSALAEKYAIKDYAGSASQNTRLLNMLKGSDVIPTITPTTTPTEAVTTGQVNIGTKEAPLLVPKGSAAHQQFATPKQPDPPEGGDEGNLVIPKDKEKTQPDMSDEDAFLAGEQERNRLEAERVAKEETTAEAKAAKEEQSWRDKIAGKGTQEEAQEEAYEDIGVDPEQWFEDNASDIAEMESLHDSYNAKMLERDNALAGVEGVGMPQGWMDDRKIVITNKYNAELNHIAAGISSKASIMAAKNNRLNEAQEFANKAVQNFIADLTFEYQRYSDFVDANDDLLADLGAEYQGFVQAEKDALYERLELQRADKIAVMRLMQDAKGGAGITIEDTLEEANAKYVQWLSEQPVRGADSKVTDFKFYDKDTEEEYDEWGAARKIVANNPMASENELVNAIRENIVDPATGNSILSVSDAKRLVREELDKVEVVTKDWMTNTLWKTEEELEEAARDAGYESTEKKPGFWGFFGAGAEKVVDTEKFLDDIMKKVEDDRALGKSDWDIIKDRFQSN